MSKPTEKEYWSDFYVQSSLALAPSRIDVITSLFCSEVEETFLLPESKRDILEVGCGSALFSKLMAEKGYAVSCCDFSPAALAAASKRLEGLAVNVFNADVRSLPIPDNSVDLVYCGGLLDVFEDPSPVFKEVLRVLRPQGLFIAVVPSKSFSIQVLADYFNSVVHTIKSLLGQPSIYWRKYRFNLKHATTKPEAFYLMSASKCGFNDVFVSKGYPVPELSMPAALKGQYVRFIRTISPILQGKIFSKNIIFRVFGIYYYVVARKI
ncbi:MAG: hypothetical protein A2X26_13230 [Chloroflexi bacterium GWC2_49_37]|nr:MAG: hypothetical protein A2X26_13230 [Chloroflexi bacterium GWC2_49_37]